MLPQKRILVTGGAGFLGGHLCDTLEIAGCNRRDWPTTPHAADPGIYVCRSQQYDLTDAAACQDVLDDLRPHVVIHLAALAGGIGANRARPAEFFYQNLTMGTNLLHHSYHAEVEKFVGIGTICSYPRITRTPFQEANLWDGYPEKTNAPYGLAKKMLLVQAQAYRQQYGFNAIYLLPTNLYGPGDNFDPESSHVIPALIRKFLEAKDTDQPSVTVWGTGFATREFLYVEDAAHAIAIATDKYDGAEPINIGSGKEISIYDLVQTIKSLVEYTGEVLWDTSKPDGQPRRCLNTTMAQNYLGFGASTTLHDGLARTIEWYRHHREMIDA